MKKKVNVGVDPAYQLNAFPTQMASLIFVLKKNGLID